MTKSFSPLEPDKASGASEEVQPGKGPGSGLHVRYQAALELLQAPLGQLQALLDLFQASLLQAPLELLHYKSKRVNRVLKSTKSGLNFLN